MRKQLLLVSLLVLALRLPFLDQAIQGDDIYYLYGAEHAQIDPLHPNHARYAFLGQIVDMRGHPHPPLNAWYLGALLFFLHTVSEIPFHAAYIPFSLIAAFSALSLARRFSPRPLAATLLFLAVPAFVVNGNSLESDLPFVAFWLASVALFIRAVDRKSIPWLLTSVLAMAAAALTAYQSIVLPIVLLPILLLLRNSRKTDSLPAAFRVSSSTYLGPPAAAFALYGRVWKPAWCAACTAPAVLGLWQLWERVTSGALPATVLAGYMQTYGLQAFDQKLKNAVALTGHLGWIVFPALALAAFWRIGKWAALAILPALIGAIVYDPNPLFWFSIGVGLVILVWCAQHVRDFGAAGSGLCAFWILIFFASALIVFFAGSARYLLPVAVPLGILVSQRVKPRWLAMGIAAEFALSIALAIVNYQHWDGYRRFARALRPDAQTRRVWINGEWGLRFYLEEEGALPLMRGQALHPGEMVITSALAYPMKVTTGGGILAPLAEQDITSSIPLRLVALNGRSAYSTTLFGLRPFDISTRVIDRVRSERVVEIQPTLERLPMNSPESSRQIVSGIYDIENGQWRWMGRQAILLLRSPPGPTPVNIRLYIPGKAPARRIVVAVNDKTVLEQTLPSPGAYTLTTPAVAPRGGSATVAITVDKTFSVPGDSRELGVILTEVGFAK